MKNPHTPAYDGQTDGQNQGLDPLEELARIMSDTKDTSPAGRTVEPSANDSALNDPLDLGLGDQGLAELFGEPPAANDAASAAAQEQAELNAFLQNLDFSDDDQSEAVAELDPAYAPDAGAELSSLPDTAGQWAPEPVSAEPAPVENARMPQVAELEAPAQAAPPMLTDHLTPRSAETHAEPDLDDMDLLAAMDELALDEPAMATAAPAAVAAAPQPAPPPLSAETYEMDFAADPSAGGAQSDHTLVAGQEFEQAAMDETAESKGPNRLVLIALGALAVLGVGGVLAFGIVGGGGGSDDMPQLIASEASDDDKVEPEVASEDTQTRPGDSVFSNLSSGEQGTATTPRVILPQPNSSGLPLNDSQRLPSVDIAPAPPGSTASRTVRTVTVRADGTVVESTTEPTVEARDVEAEATNARPVEVIAVNPAPAINAVADTAQEAARAALAEATRAVAQTTGAASGTPPAPVARPAGITPVQTQPVAVAPVAVQPQAPTQQVAPAPVQLTAPQAAPAQPVTPQPVETAAVTPATTPASVGAGNFIVQLASLRSQEEAQATFNRLQNRFGSILGGFGPNIQRADLGDRGIYHRVRVGPMDRASADTLCRRYQAAGGDCFVQRQ